MPLRHRVVVGSVLSYQIVEAEKKIRCAALLGGSEDLARELWRLSYLARVWAEFVSKG